MRFEEAHAAFIRCHLDLRAGERKGRLERGHGHGEKLFCQNIWWELKGNFEGLHPEYEVTDWRGKSYFADFAYKIPGWKGAGESSISRHWAFVSFPSHMTMWRATLGLSSPLCACF